MNKRIKPLLIVPLLVPAVAAIVTGTVATTGSLFSKSDIAVMVLVFGVPLTYVCVIFLGLPVYFYLLNTRRLNSRSLFSSGAITSLIVSSVALLHDTQDINHITYEYYLLIAIVSITGGVSAVLFGLYSNDI